MFGKLKKENEFLKRLVAAVLPGVDVCHMCVFNGTLPQGCEYECVDCTVKEKMSCACCNCVDGCNFLWDGRGE